jgi:formyl-CoA transferase
MLDFQAARWLIAHEVPEQAGNDHPTSIPTGVFRTRDGHINIASAGDEIFRRLCRALDTPELADHPDYRTGKLRSDNRKALNAAIDAITETRDSAEWIERFNKAGVPAGPIYTMDQVFADPQVKHLGAAQTVHSDAIGRDVTLLAQPIVMSRTPSKITLRPPERGEHSDAILAELGYTKAQIGELRSRDIV